MNKKTLYVTQSAVIAAIYVVLVFVFQYTSFGPIQFRIAEALTILPYYTPAAIPGVTIGCLLSNLLFRADIIDIISLAGNNYSTTYPITEPQVLSSNSALIMPINLWYCRYILRQSHPNYDATTGLQIA